MLAEMQLMGDRKDKGRTDRRTNELNKKGSAKSVFFLSQKLEPKPNLKPWSKCDTILIAIDALKTKERKKNVQAQHKGKWVRHEIGQDGWIMLSEDWTGQDSKGQDSPPLRRSIVFVFRIGRWEKKKKNRCAL